MSWKNWDMQVGIFDVHKGQKVCGWIFLAITRNILDKGVQGSSEETLSCKGLEKQRLFARVLHSPTFQLKSSLRVHLQEIHTINKMGDIH